jgi:hypothetical protein
MSVELFENAGKWGGAICGPARAARIKDVPV